MWNAVMAILPAEVRKKRLLPYCRHFFQNPDMENQVARCMASQFPTVLNQVGSRQQLALHHHSAHYNGPSCPMDCPHLLAQTETCNTSATTFTCVLHQILGLWHHRNSGTVANLWPPSICSASAVCHATSLCHCCVKRCSTGSCECLQLLLTACSPSSCKCLLLLLRVCSTQIAVHAAGSCRFRQ